MVTAGASSASSTRGGGFGGFGEDAPLPLAGVDERAVAAKLRDGSVDRFADALASVGNCARPVRLHGSSVTVDAATGEVLDTFTSAGAPLGVLYRPCGNRREHVCPACSRTYARDTFELIRAGACGGKTVPAAVADNPLIFLTLTAPSFGPVHRAAPTACRPRRADSRTRCAHGRPTWCGHTHQPGSPQAGAPLCPHCHDTTSAVVWQWWAPELWRRTTITIRRRLAAALGVPEARLAEHASIQYAKVAEYQHRGLVHFHALVRLDGPTGDGIGSPAPGRLDAPRLRRVLLDAAAATRVTADPVDPDDQPRTLRWGAQVDARVVHAGRTDTPDGPLTPAQVAGYLAKYATKDATTILGDRHTRPHLAAIRATAHQLHARALAAHGLDSPYALLGKWAPMLGFRGHFSTKSRRYSITLGALRRARHRWQALAAQSRRTGTPLDTADLEERLLADDDQETTLVIGSWAYAGTGWRDTTEHALALATAARAREHHQWQAARTHGTHDRRNGRWHEDAEA